MYRGSIGCRFSVPSSSAGFGGVAGAGVSESDEDDVDLDLVVDVGRDVELEGEVVLGRDPELAKIVAYVCGCSLKMPTGESGCIKQFDHNWIFERRLSMNELSNGEFGCFPIHCNLFI